MAKRPTKRLTKSPAVILAQNGNGSTPKLNEPITLSTGVKAVLRVVPSATIIQAQTMIEDIPIPRQTIEGKEGTFENPLDPDYIKKTQQVNIERANAVYDVTALFGVELVDGLPDDDKWLEKLQFLVKLKRLDVDKYDLDNEIEREFVYKRYIAMGNADWSNIMSLSGISVEDVVAAKDSF